MLAIHYSAYMIWCHWTFSLSWYIYRKRRFQFRTRASNIYIIKIFNVVSSAFPYSTMAVSKCIRILCTMHHFPKTSKLRPLLLHNKYILRYYLRVHVCQFSSCFQGKWNNNMNGNGWGCFMPIFTTRITKNVKH